MAEIWKIGWCKISIHMLKIQHKFEGVSFIMQM